MDNMIFLCRSILNLEWWFVCIMVSVGYEDDSFMNLGRVTIGLYNSYDQKFREQHRRIIARASDLAMAFNMNLALFGFPTPN